MNISSERLTVLYADCSAATLIFTTPRAGSKGIMAKLVTEGLPWMPGQVWTSLLSPTPPLSTPPVLGSGISRCPAPLRSSPSYQTRTL